MQGDLIDWTKITSYFKKNYFIIISFFFLYSADICVRKVNELSQYQMIWTDEDGFLLKALGKLMYS